MLFCNGFSGELFKFEANIIGSLSNDDGDGNENGKKAVGWQNNNFARAPRFFVHFLAVAAQLQPESA